ncbi:amidohydrolase family protein [Palleronia abyssalis]|uniref:4-sulfomuconolactone hydrolase n=1 Tax=Palleronia abyssalis TaxID=1501240 RepID=A0A2R8BV45_9RHOB|nr:amidohydrolase family protein [Palleronia abyssalis]SPJ23966.1 4-sulfomuconolactone hydrolase [Palleronia abyssalis]
MVDDDRDLPDATPDRDYDTVSELPCGMFPADRPKVPSTLPPQGACDTHLHLVGGKNDFPLWAERKEDPAPGRGFEDWLDLLRTHMSTLELSRGVIVHSTLYGDDNSVTIEALKRLGQGYVGVGLVRDDANEDVLDRLAEARVRGIRLNEVFDGPLSWEGAKHLAHGLAERGMHLELLQPADRIAELSEQISELPCDVVIGHLGWPDIAAGADAPGFQAVRRLVAEGKAYAKLTGLYRLADAPYDAAAPFVDALAATPERCLWGSDWPHLMLNGASVPDAGVLLDRFFDHVTDAERRQAILVDAPADLYGF